MADRIRSFARVALIVTAVAAGLLLADAVTDEPSLQLSDRTSPPPPAAATESLIEDPAGNVVVDCDGRTVVVTATPLPALDGPAPDDEHGSLVASNPLSLWEHVLTGIDLPAGVEFVPAPDACSRNQVADAVGNTPWAQDVLESAGRAG